MKLILAGKFENALITKIDEIIQPARNCSTNDYYVGLNRKVTPNYFDRCGTFIALADTILVPTVDWNYPYGDQYRRELKAVDLGIERTDPELSEWDKNTVKFVEAMLKQRALSTNSRAYISNLSFAHYPDDVRKHMNQNAKKYQKAAARHYLCRLFLQLKSARESGSLVVISEEDIQVLNEVGSWMSRGKSPVPFDIPDLKGKLIEPETLASGLLNFSPPDILSVAAVRSDKQIRKYAEKIDSLLQGESTLDQEREMLAAMVEAHEKSEAGKRAEKVFEVLSWIVKPFHYVPGVDAGLSLVEDAKDVLVKFVERDVSQKDWHLLAVRMTDVALRDYLNRKSNLLSR